MGGMFSVLKVRRNQKPGDYKDPGWYKHPPGTVAYEVLCLRHYRARRTASVAQDEHMSSEPLPFGTGSPGS